MNMIYNLYKTNDLYGDFLTKPLKAYNEYYSDKGTGWKNVALTVYHIATGIFAYPIFGALALLGMTIKLAGVYSLITHNNAQKEVLNAPYIGMKSCENYYRDQLDVEEEFNIEMELVHAMKLTKKSIDQDYTDIINKIDSMTKQFKRVYLDCRGNGEILVKLKVQDYCKEFKSALEI